MPNYTPTTFAPLPFAPIRSGYFSVTLAQTPEEVMEAQALRYHVFVDEMQADVPQIAHELQRDIDEFDALCDHLLVRYHDGDTTRIIGTYRMLRGDTLPQDEQFYSEAEYDISALKVTGARLLEMGRSCTQPDFRQKAAMQLLWRGIGEYVMHHKIDYLFGCASFEGTDPQAHAQGLSYLHHNHRADSSIRPRSLPAHYVAMDMLEVSEVDAKRAFFKLPILVKGYLRLGGVVGDGAFIDHAFNTTDIMVIVETKNVSDKHVSRYAPDSVSGGDS